MEYEKGFYSISKLMVISGFIGFIIGLAAFRLVGELEHALIIGLFSIPIFVSGVYLNMFPGNKDAAHFWDAFLQLLLYWISFAFLWYLKIYFALFALSLAFMLMFMLIIYSWERFKQEFYFQKILGFSAYLLLTIGLYALIIGYRVSSENVFEVVFLVIYYIAIGLIYAVNSTGIPYTYGEKARGKVSYMIFISEVLVLVVYFIWGFGLSLIFVLFSYIFYLALVRVETIPNWFRFVSKLRPLTRPKHYNLLFAHIISFVFLPSAIILYLYNVIEVVSFIHVVLFGFVLPQILGHGVVLLPILMRKKPRFTKLFVMLSPISGAAALLRIFGEEYEFLNGLSGGLVLILVILLAVMSMKYLNAKVGDK